MGLQAVVVDSEFFLITVLGWAILVICIVVGISCVIVSIWNIVVPNVWSYPWPEIREQKDNDKKTTIVMAGSFNPPHLGHIEMIRYLASRYRQVIVVVGHNPNKNYAVTPTQRVHLLNQCLLPNNVDKNNKDNSDKNNNNKGSDNVTVQTVAGYIWQHVPQAHLFFRGIRTWEKDGAEERSLQISNIWGPIVFGPLWRPRITYFLQGNPKYNHISSTLIRDICSSSSSSRTTTQEESYMESSLKQLVPECIVSQVRLLYSPKK